MATYEIKVPDGRTIKVRADSPEQALEGAEEWASANPAREKRSMLESAINGVASGLTLGFDDEIAAGLQTGFGMLGDYDETVSEFRKAKGEMAEDNPVTNFVGEVAGGIGTGAGMAARGATLLGRTAGKGAMTRLGAGALEGAGYGAVAGAGNADDGSRTEGALYGGALGGVVGGAVPAVASQVSKLKPVAETLKNLKSAKDAAYKAVDASGARYSQSGFKALVGNIEKSMIAKKMNPRRHEKAASMLDDLKQMVGEAPTLTELDQLRQVIRRDVVKSGDDSNAFLGKEMIKEIDRFMDMATPQSMQAGDAKTAAKLIKDARAANLRLSKAEEIEAAINSADLRAASTGSGGNVDNATRQNLRRVLEKGQGYTDAEKAALERTVRGTNMQNRLRKVGKLSPDGNGLMAALNLGATAMNPLFAIPGAAGLVSKILADGATVRNVADLELLVRGAATPQNIGAVRKLLANEKLMDTLARSMSMRAGELGAIPAK